MIDELQRVAENRFTASESVLDQSRVLSSNACSETYMAASVTSLPTTFGLSHGDECCNRSPTKSPLSGHHLAVKRKGHSLHYERSGVRRLVVTHATEGSRKSKESEPSWANPDSDEPPPWARNEGVSSTSQEGFEIPFYVYLLASAITAIAAVCFFTPLLSFNCQFHIKDVIFMHNFGNCRLVLFSSTQARIQFLGSWNQTVSFILLCLDSLL